LPNCSYVYLVQTNHPFSLLKPHKRL